MSGWLAIPIATLGNSVGERDRQRPRANRQTHRLNRQIPRGESPITLDRIARYPGVNRQSPSTESPDTLGGIANHLGRIAKYPGVNRHPSQWQSPLLREEIATVATAIARHRRSGRHRSQANRQITRSHRQRLRGESPSTTHTFARNEGVSSFCSRRCRHCATIEPGHVRIDRRDAHRGTSPSWQEPRRARRAAWQFSAQRSALGRGRLFANAQAASCPVCLGASQRSQARGADRRGRRQHPRAARDRPTASSSCATASTDSAASPTARGIRARSCSAPASASARRRRRRRRVRGRRSNRRHAADHPSGASCGVPSGAQARARRGNSRKSAGRGCWRARFAQEDGEKRRLNGPRPIARGPRSHLARDGRKPPGTVSKW